MADLLDGVWAGIADDDAELGFAGVSAFIGRGVVLRDSLVGEDFIAVTDGDGGVLGLAVVQDADAYGGVGVAACDLIDEVVAVLDLAAVDGGDDVAGLEAGFIGGAAGLNGLDEHAVLEVIDTVDRAGEALLELDADGAADDLVAGADEVVVDGDDGIGGHCETDALVAGRLGVDRGIDADDFAVHVEQRAAGVAGVDGGVGLDEVLELAAGAGLDGAVLGGDDSGGDGLREGEGAADGFDVVAHLRHVAVAQLDGGQGGIGVDLDDGEVGGLVDADDARRAAEVLGVGVGGELDVDLVGLVDDVVVGDDVALGVDDETGAEGLADLVIAVIALVGDLAAEEAVEEVLEAGVLVLIVLVVVVAAVGVLLIRLVAVVEAAAAGAVSRLLGQRLSVDIDDCRAHFLGDSDKSVGGDGGAYDLEGRGVGAGALLFLACHTMRQERAADNAHRKCAEQEESRGETARAKPFEERFHVCLDLVRFVIIPGCNLQYNERRLLASRQPGCNCRLQCAPLNTQVSGIAQCHPGA